MKANLLARLKKLEAARRPSLPMRAFVIQAAGSEDAALQLAQAMEERRYGGIGPVLVFTGLPRPLSMEAPQ